VITHKCDFFCPGVHTISLFGSLGFILLNHIQNKPFMYQPNDCMPVVEKNTMARIGIPIMILSLAIFITLTCIKISECNTNIKDLRETIPHLVLRSDKNNEITTLVKSKAKENKQ
jgi:hypothetical protein